MDAHLFGHLANVLFGLAYLVKDMLWLRLISIVACFIMIFFNYFAPEKPLWVAIFWNAVFILVNVVRSSMLYIEQKQAKFSGKEKELYESIFRHMSPVEFAKVLRNGSWNIFHPESVITEQGKKPDALVLIYRGTAKVKRDNDKRAIALNSGAFVGEMSLATDELASASVSAESEIDAFCWPREKLDKLFRENPNLKASFQLTMASDMARKLKTV